MDYVTGITTDGERLRFERWVYQRWTLGILNDPMLCRMLSRCVQFTMDY